MEVLERLRDLREIAKSYNLKLKLKGYSSFTAVKVLSFDKKYENGYCWFIDDINNNNELKAFLENLKSFSENENVKRLSKEIKKLDKHYSFTFLFAPLRTAKW